MAGARIRRLRERDIPRAIELTDLEGWGYSREDWRLLLELSEDGCFAAEADGQVAGVLSTTPYGPVAYLGAVVVDPGMRGRGVGEAMMEAALDHLDARGVQTVVLNAYVHVVPFYKRLGFRTQWENVRWEGSGGSGTEGNVRRARVADLSAITAFDEAFFGASRRALLRRLRREYSSSFLLAEDRGDIVGYIVANTSLSTAEIGPWVANPTMKGAAPALFGALHRSGSVKAFAFTAPMTNPRPHRFARAAGCREAFRTVRMFRGKDAHHGKPEGIWGFAGLEKG